MKPGVTREIASALRRRWVAAVVALAGGAMAPVIACDIFHSTDLPTLCTDASSAPGCAEGGVPPFDAGSPFTKDPPTALANAKTTCAWLSACETPMGQNQTGLCLANAILAFDQTTNPNREPRGDARAFWQCAFAAAKKRSCGALHACILDPKNNCGDVSIISCVGGARANCETKGELPNVESCAALGHACGALNGNVDGICTGVQQRACAQSGCNGSQLSVCDDAGLDHGLDCASVGTGTCVASPVLTCAPVSVGTCTQSSGVWCDGGVAIACPTGAPEWVDCARIAGSGGCVDMPEAGAPLTPSDACRQPQANAACTQDKCNGDALSACVRGRVVPVDCTAEGLGACGPITTRSDGLINTCTKK